MHLFSGNLCNVTMEVTGNVSEFSDALGYARVPLESKTFTEVWQTCSGMCDLPMNFHCGSNRWRISGGPRHLYAVKLAEL